MTFHVSEQEITEFNRRSDAFNANTAALHEYHDAHPELQRYVGAIFVTFAANGKAAGFVCSLDPRYLRLIENRIKARVMDPLAPTRVTTRFIYDKVVDDGVEKKAKWIG